MNLSRPCKYLLFAEFIYVYNYIYIYKTNANHCTRHLKSITNREVSCYSISAKNQVNIDITLQWLIKKGKGQK
jgi:hypothetical protein